jgi:hypothetical protein
VKVTAILDETGKVRAARIHTSPPEGDPTDEAPTVRFVLSEGEEEVELDVPDEEIPTDPGEEFLEALRQHSERQRSA